MSNQSGWHKKTIADLFSSSCPGEWGNEGNHDSGTPVLRSTNFRNNGYIDYSYIAYRAIPSSRLDSRRIDIGTILIEKAGGSSTRPAGRVVYCDRAFGGTASNFVEVVQVDTALSAKFVFYLLYHNFHSGLVHKYQQQTTGIINFKLREYSQEVITVPESRDEQSKVAEVLSTVDRAIAQSEALIAKQQRIKTGLMQDLLTRGIDPHGNLRSEATHAFKDSPLGRIPAEWEVDVGSKYFSLHAGIPTSAIEWNPEGSTLYLKVDDFNDPQNADGIVGAENCFNCPIGLESRMLTPETLVFPKRGAAIFLNRVEILRKKATLDPNLMGLRARQDVVAEFLKLVLLHRNLGNICDNSGIPQINNKHLYPLEFAMPSPREQEEIVRRTRQTKHGILSTSARLQKLRSLKTGLMQDLLTGKVRVTPLLEPAEEATA